MEAILKTPAMHHISKDIFQFLDKTSLKNCRQVNTSWKKALDQPQFWLKKLEEISTVQEFEIWKSVQKTKGYSKLNNPSSSRKQSRLAEKKPGQFAEMLRRKLELGLESISLWKKVQREPVLKSWDILAQKIVDYHDENLKADFVLILMKMFESQLFSPVAMVIKLQKELKYPDLIEFLNKNPLKRLSHLSM